MLDILEWVNQLLWGFPVLILLSFAHLYFTVYLKFPQRHLCHAIRLSVTSESSGFTALATTLAATLGTGNIIGVSTAIAVGGPGALFWCWLTGFFGMATCYAECYLSILFRKPPTPMNRRINHGAASASRSSGRIGGPMYVLEYGLKRKGLGRLYAGCALLAAFGVGCTTQASAITEALRTIRLPSRSEPVTAHPYFPHAAGILAAFIAGLVILGGIRSIGSFCTKVVPILGFFYLGFCCFLLIQNRDYLLSSLILIAESAFQTKAAAGGFIGSTLMSAARYGIARGLFTNEAGVGTAAIAAASADTDDPHRQGLISMTAVFWDTVVMCAVTGLLIVSNIQKNPSSVLSFGPASLTSAAFTFLPFGGETILAVSLVAFALTTLIGWCYSGERACAYLFGEGSLPSYHLVYLVMIYIGAVLPMDLVWSITDLINAVMIFPSCYALFALRKKITPSVSGPQ